MNITVVGIGYVGLSNAILLAQKNKVIALDLNIDKIKKINERISPLDDAEIIDFLKNHSLELKATSDKHIAYQKADYIIVSTPTDYDTETNFFDTSSIEVVLKEAVLAGTKATFVIKSTIPVGFTESLSKKFSYPNILFSPEFLREGKALYDNLHPSRIIVGCDTNSESLFKKAEVFAELLSKGALDENIPTMIIDRAEAEAIKLFSNTYLAMRISFFNELDTYAEHMNLNTRHIVEGMGYDPRIGNYYNNPSFGYGGYCLPKDTKQILANYKNIPNDIIAAIVSSNKTRKEHIVEKILKKLYNDKSISNIVGVYRLIMKTNSDNFRHSSIRSIIRRLSDYNIEIIIYEPTLKDEYFEGCKVENNWQDFANKSKLILANRFDNTLIEVKKKVYTRDIFYRD